MSTTSLSSLLSTVNPSNESIAELLGESSASAASTSGTTSADADIQDAVNALLNSSTSTSGSGIDVTSTVDAILEVDAAPEIQMQNQVTADNAQTSALTSIGTDLASLQTAVQALNDPAGALSNVTVSSSNNDVVSATASNGTAAASHSIDVLSLASTSAAYSAPQQSATSALPMGTLTIQVGSNQAVTIPVDNSPDNTDTLTGLAGYINNAKMGVTASVVTEGSGTALLSLVSQTSGSAGKLQITDNTSTGNALGFSMATDSNGNALGSDAELTVDGVPVTSSSNTVTGAIPGVTLTLSGTSDSPVTLAVQPDLTQAATAVNNFVTAWNQVMTDINNQNTVSTSGTAQPLLGDPSLDDLQSQLLSGITGSLSGNNGLVNLQSAGIQLQGDGTLSVASSSSTDSMDLNDALANDFTSVQNLFQSSGGPGQTLASALTTLTNTVTGPLSVDMTGISSEVTDLNSEISDFQSNLQNTQTQLMTEYSNINTTLEQLPETIASITSQIQALNPQTTQS